MTYGEGTTAGKSESQEGRPHPPYSETHQFLMVNVKAGATRRELVEAVERALESRNLPFFKVNTKPGDPNPKPCLPVEDDESKLCPGEALLLYMHQEGW